MAGEPFSLFYFSPRILLSHSLSPPELTAKFAFISRLLEPCPTCPIPVLETWHPLRCPHLSPLSLYFFCLLKRKSSGTVLINPAVPSPWSFYGRISEGKLLSTPCLLPLQVGGGLPSTLQRKRTCLCFIFELDLRPWIWVLTHLITIKLITIGSYGEELFLRGFIFGCHLELIGND